MKKFPKEIHNQLGVYVYRLIDPRTGHTFYVGKGQGNRVFAHIAENIDQDDEDDLSAKLKTIRLIKNAGLEPIHIIHRHGLTNDEALHVEAALIDVLGELTNVQAGVHSNSKGPANAVELVTRYSSPEMELKAGEKIISIDVRKSIEEKSVYDAVRFAWRINVKRAQEADYVLATTNGVCRDVFVVENWLPAEVRYFSGLAAEDIPGRYGFVGKSADPAVKDRFVDKRLPPKMKRKKGMASPILYSY